MNRAQLFTLRLTASLCVLLVLAWSILAAGVPAPLAVVALLTGAAFGALLDLTARRRVSRHDRAAADLHAYTLGMVARSGAALKAGK